MLQTTASDVHLNLSELSCAYKLSTSVSIYSTMHEPLPQSAFLNLWTLCVTPHYSALSLGAFSVSDFNTPRMHFKEALEIKIWEK